MDGIRRWRWERVLLLLATMLGVVAMHAIVGPGHDAAAPIADVAGVSAAPIAGGPTGHDPMMSFPIDAHAESVPAPADMPMPMPMAHELMHLCLAIMAMGLAVGLLVVACALRMSSTRFSRRATARVCARPSRPPRPHAVRLAQLCVLRN